MLKCQPCPFPSASGKLDHPQPVVRKSARGIELERPPLESSAPRRAVLRTGNVTPGRGGPARSADRALPLDAEGRWPRHFDPGMRPEWQRRPECRHFRERAPMLAGTTRVPPASSCRWPSVQIRAPRDPPRGSARGRAPPAPHCAPARRLPRRGPTSTRPGPRRRAPDTPMPERMSDQVPPPACSRRFLSPCPLESADRQRIVLAGRVGMRRRLHPAPSPPPRPRPSLARSTIRRF